MLTIKTTERRYWRRSDVFIVNLAYVTRYSTASVVDFEQVNVSLEPIFWIPIYPRAEDAIALLSLLWVLLIAGFDI